MLVLGVMLFLVLIVGFLYQLLHRRSVSALLAFFLLPIAMIGYPSIQTIQYQNGVLTIDKTTRELRSRPADPALRQTLQKQVAALADRPSSAKDTIVLAKAQYELGNEQAATRDLQKALRADPNAAEARELQQKILVVNSLNRFASQVEANPTNTAAKAELQRSVQEAAQLHIVNPAALIQVAHAQTVLGEHEKALATANKALAISPNSADALRLRDSIKARIESAAPAGATPP